MFSSSFDVTYEQDGRAFEHVKSLYRGDRDKFVTELHRQAGKWSALRK